MIVRTVRQLVTDLADALGMEARAVRDNVQDVAAALRYAAREPGHVDTQAAHDLERIIPGPTRRILMVDHVATPRAIDVALDFQKHSFGAEVLNLARSSTSLSRRLVYCHNKPVMISSLKRHGESYASKSDPRFLNIVIYPDRSDPEACFVHLAHETAHMVDNATPVGRPRVGETEDSYIARTVAVYETVEARAHFAHLYSVQEVLWNGHPTKALADKLIEQSVPEVWHAGWLPFREGKIGFDEAMEQISKLIRPRYEKRYEEWAREVWVVAKAGPANDRDLFAF